MKTKWLFPHRFRLIGWLIFVPFAVLGLALFYYELDIISMITKALNKSITVTVKVDGSISALFGNRIMTDEIAAFGIIVGLMLIAFSREKVEDEMISQLRLEALQWSVYANYIILAIAILTVYENAFLNVMIYNMFTMLLVFVIRFRWLIYRNNHMLLTL